ncbi:MAG TPA: GntR family transcriptional regulator [Candidatus Gallacutalibacter stercoravium]|nr:GntR family transcriptional regulator [Candidatus Gallacutalibacter stercoravium]
MTWQLTADRPIYLQLMEAIKLQIVSGAYQAGERLPPVRDIAAQAGVNPNTMQKALSELERDGLVYSQRTAGRFITEDENMIVKMRNELAQDRIQAFFEGMSRLGFTREETMEMLNRAAQEQQQKGD